MEGTVSEQEILTEITDWLAAGAAIDKPRIEDGWFCVQDLLASGMTEHIARKQVKMRYDAQELERKKYHRTWYYKKV